MKNNMCLVAVVGLTALFAVGCGQRNTSGRAAVLDLDAVAKEIGWDAEMNQAITERGKVLDEQLIRKKTHFENMLEKTASEFGSQPTEEQQQEIMRFQARANEQLQLDLQNSRQQVIQYRIEMITDFRNLINPLAVEVAKRKGLSLILLKTETLFYADERVDITTEVIAKLRENEALRNSLMRLVTAPDLANGTQEKSTDSTTTVNE